MEVVRGKAADKAGLKEGDIIVALDGRGVESVDAVHKLLGASSIGREIPARVLRGAKMLDLTVTPAE